MARLIRIIGCLMLLVACGSPEQPSSAVSQSLATATLGAEPTPSRIKQAVEPSVTATAAQPTFTPTAAPQQVAAILVHISEASSFKGGPFPVKVGTMARLTIELTPAITSEGMIRHGSNVVSWNDLGVKEMRMCMMLDSECVLPEEWQPFQFEPTETTFEVDWVGERQFWVGLEVRDNEGNPIPLLHYYDLVNLYHYPISILGEIDSSIPEQPPVAQTAIVATETAFPVNGAIEIADGKCCIGGLAGDAITISVRFTAASPHGNVTSMQIQGSSWEPFVKQKEFKRHVPINFTGWSLCVQYKDDQGNLSPVYCDDISIEGMPKQP